MSRSESLRRLVEARRRVSLAMRSVAAIEQLARRGSRKRPPGAVPAMVEPPRGPLPKQGGAAAPLEFD